MSWRKDYISVCLSVFVCVGVLGCRTLHAICVYYRTSLIGSLTIILHRKDSLWQHDRSSLITIFILLNSCEELFDSQNDRLQHFNFVRKHIPLVTCVGFYQKQKLNTCCNVSCDSPQLRPMLLSPNLYSWSSLISTIRLLTLKRICMMCMIRCEVVDILCRFQGFSIWIYTDDSDNWLFFLVQFLNWDCSDLVVECCVFHPSFDTISIFWAPLRQNFSDGHKSDHFSGIFGPKEKQPKIKIRRISETKKISGYVTVRISRNPTSGSGKFGTRPN